MRIDPSQIELNRLVVTVMIVMTVMTGRSLYTQRRLPTWTVEVNGDGCDSDNDPFIPESVATPPARQCKPPINGRSTSTAKRRCSPLEGVDLSQI